MIDREKLIEMIGRAPCVGFSSRTAAEHIADHLIANGVVFKDQYEDMEERIVQQRVRAQTAENFICGMCEECDTADYDGLTIMQLKCCSTFPECGKFKPRSRWIPVTERLPEDRKNKLVYLSSNRMMLAKYNEHRLPHSDEAIGWGYSVNEGYIDFEKEKVTHWMPLPEPPKGGG